MADGWRQNDAAVCELCGGIVVPAFCGDEGSTLVSLTLMMLSPYAKVG